VKTVIVEDQAPPLVMEQSLWEFHHQIEAEVIKMLEGLDSSDFGHVVKIHAWRPYAHEARGDWSKVLRIDVHFCCDVGSIQSNQFLVQAQDGVATLEPMSRT